MRLLYHRVVAIADCALVMCGKSMACSAGWNVVCVSFSICARRADGGSCEQCIFLARPEILLEGLFCFRLMVLGVTCLNVSAVRSMQGLCLGKPM